MLSVKRSFRGSYGKPSRATAHCSIERMNAGFYADPQIAILIVHLYEKHRFQLLLFL